MLGIPFGFFIGCKGQSDQMNYIQAQVIEKTEKD
jgi:hypothetical protein